MDTGRVFLRVAYRAMLAGIKGVPGVGAVVSIADEAIETWWACQAELEEAERLRAIEEAQTATQDELQQIKDTVLRQLQAEGQQVSPERAEAIGNIFDALPSRVAQQTQAVLTEAKRNGTAPATVLPISNRAADEASQKAFLKSLVPPYRPRFTKGDRVPHAHASWTIDALLGAGGFGEVWKVRDRESGAIHAVKFCLDASKQEVLLREADAVRAVRDALPMRHPNLVGVTGLNTYEDPYWIAFEYVSGGDLHAWIQGKGGPRTWDEVAPMARQILAGMGAAHDVGLVHRDLNPQNILLDAHGTAKIADFGLGKILADDDAAEAPHTQRFTMAGAGTEGYMSPEQQEAMPADPSDDVYALAVIFYQMLMGQPTRPPRYLRRDLARLPMAPPEAVIDTLEDGIRFERGRRAATAYDLWRTLASVAPGIEVVEPSALADTTEPDPGASGGGVPAARSGGGDRPLRRRLQEVFEQEGTGLDDERRMKCYIEFQSNGGPSAGFVYDDFRRIFEEEAARFADDRAFDLARRENTEAAYTRYLQAHPQGRHRSDAERNERELRTTREAQERAERDQVAEARRTDTIDGWRRYLQISNRRTAEAEAKQRIGELEDEREWEAACTADTIAAYERYRAGSKARLHGDEAAKRIEGLRHADAIAALEAARARDTMKAWRDWLDTYQHSAPRWATEEAVRRRDKANARRRAYAVLGAAVFALLGAGGFYVTPYVRLWQYESIAMNESTSLDARIRAVKGIRELGFGSQADALEKQVELSKYEAIAMDESRPLEARIGAVNGIRDLGFGSQADALGERVASNAMDESRSLDARLRAVKDIRDLAVTRQLDLLENKTVSSVQAAASVDAIPGDQFASRIISLKEGGIIIAAQSFEGHSGAVASVAFSPDGGFALTGSNDNTAKLWRLDGRGGVTLAHTLEGHRYSVSSVAFSPDGRWALTAGPFDDTAKLWRLDGRGGATFAHTLEGHSRGVESVAFSPDGVFALTGSHDDTAKLWRLDGRGGATLAHTLGHSSWVESVAFSPDGHWALTGSSEGYQEAGTAKLWRIIPRETEAE